VCVEGMRVMGWHPCRDAGFDFTWASGDVVAALLNHRLHAGKPPASRRRPVWTISEVEGSPACSRWCSPATHRSWRASGFGNVWQMRGGVPGGRNGVTPEGWTERVGCRLFNRRLSTDSILWRFLRIKRTNRFRIWCSWAFWPGAD